MDFSVLTIFPELINSFSDHGIIRRSIERNIISVSAINIRDFAEGRHKVTDDRPYGGGCGMVMKPEPLASAIKSAKKTNPSAITIHLTPQGRPFDQKLAHELLENKGLILICGRYEGIDERINNNFIDDEISIGDYVLTGGEIASLVIIDAVSRLIPGALGGIDSADRDSFEDDLLEHGHYTRPQSFMGDEVPEILLSGNHAEIEKWRLEKSLIRTFLKRPDLLKERQLSSQEINIIKKWRSDLKKLTHD